MAKIKIAGISIGIDADMTKLNKEFADAGRDAGSLQKELKQVERMLKYDPSNIELLAQKEIILKEEVGKLGDQLDIAREAQNKLHEQFEKGESSAENVRAIDRQVIELQQSIDKLESESDQAFKNVEGDLKEVAGQADKTTKSIGDITKGISQKSGNISKTMVPATAAISALGVMSFNAASDVAESQNKVAVAFGDSSKSVESFAENSLESFGIAKGTALDMSAMFGDMATSMGLPQSEAANMATSMTGLAGDLASFKNIGIDQSMTALNGVFTGETESLKTLGIVMTQANLEAFALSKGITTNIADMSQAEQVNLRYAYVMDKTKNAQGDFAKTSDGAANSVRIMQESAKELSAEFGEALLPIITPIIQKITDLVQWFTNLDDGTKNTIVTIALVIAAISPVAGIISAVTGAISGIAAILPVATAATTAQTAATTAAGVATTTATLPIIAIIAAIAALIAIIVLVVKNWDKIKEVAAAVWEKIKEIWSAVSGWFKSSVIDPVAGFFEGLGQTIVNIWNGIINGIKGAINGIIGFINGMIRGITNGINAVIRVLNKLSFNIPDWIPGIGGKKFGFNLGELNAPQIPLLAKGGILSSGQAIVGENGAELLSIVNGGKAQVTPLTDGQRSGAIQAAGLSAPGGYSVVIETFNNYDTDVDSPTLIRRISEGLQKQQMKTERAMG